VRRQKVKVPRTAREKAVALARDLLGDEKVVSFLRRCGDAENQIFACKLFRDELAAGGDLDTIFYTGKVHGFSFCAKPLASGTFEISFGYVTGGGLGDGGTWFTEFGGDCSVLKISSQKCWVA
jgi:hypothetical protein